MGATARAPVLMSPDEKAALGLLARKAGRISAAELMRRTVVAYDIGDQFEAAEMRAGLALFKEIRTEMVAQLDHAHRKLDTTLAAFDR